MLHKTTEKPTWRSLLDDIIRGLLSFYFRKEFIRRQSVRRALQAAQPARKIETGQNATVRTTGIYQQRQHRAIYFWMCPTNFEVCRCVTILTVVMRASLKVGLCTQAVETGRIEYKL